MKTLDDLIKELQNIQAQGKGSYAVTDGYFGNPIIINVYDDDKLIML